MRINRNRIMYGLMALGVVLMIVVYGVERCENNRYQIHGPWKVEKKNVITWQNVDTIVLSDTIFKIACPDCFEVRKDLQAGDSSLVLMHKEREDMYMLAYVTENRRRWNCQEAADTISLIRNTQEGDTVMIKDMHDGYFYLKGHSRSREYNFYEQHVADSAQIYSLCFFYPYYMNDDEVQNILNLVHNWNPK